MQALILCAGLGTRLKPLTDSVPKVMLPIGAKPLLEHHFEQFKKHGVKEFLINLHYLPDKVTDYFGNGSKWGIRITYKYEPEILGTAGAVKNFEKEIKDDFFLIYGDVLSLVNYSKLLDFYQKRTPCSGIEMVGETDHPLDSDLVELDNNFRFIKIYQKPHQKLPQTYYSMKGVFIFNQEILDFIPDNQYYEIDHQLLPKIIWDNSFYGYLQQKDDYIKDIGTPERYQEAKLRFKNFLS